MKRTILAILLVLLLAGCSTTDRPPSGQTWLLDSMTIDGSPIDLTSTNPITLETTDGNAVSGSSGCNLYFGELEFKAGGVVTGSQFGGTEMACDKGMDVEAAYLTALGRIDKYTFSEFELTLTADGGLTVLNYLLLQTAPLIISSRS
ncbi:MAG: META domain-containing protein [Bellilinea sp.]